MDSKEYSESLLDAKTKDYGLHTRKSYVSFDAYDLEAAFEEGQKNPVWIYEGEPEEVIYLVDDFYEGFTTATYNKEKDEWIDSKGHKLLGVNRWMKFPK